MSLFRCHATSESGDHGPVRLCLLANPVSLAVQTRLRDQPAAPFHLVNVIRRIRVGFFVPVLSVQLVGSPVVPDGRS